MFRPMYRVVVVASLVLLASAACRHSLENPDDPGLNDAGRRCAPSASPTCIAIDGQSTFAAIQTNVFEQNCGSTSCHGAATEGSRIDLRAGASHANLVNATSMFDATRTLVVPNNPAQSYLLLLLRHIEPSQADPPSGPPPDSSPGAPNWMPAGQDGEPICCQKLDAIQRWIEAGALND